MQWQIFDWSLDELVTFSSDDININWDAYGFDDFECKRVNDIITTFEINFDDGKLFLPRYLIEDVSSSYIVGSLINAQILIPHPSWAQLWERKAYETNKGLEIIRNRIMHHRNPIALYALNGEQLYLSSVGDKEED